MNTFADKLTYYRKLAGLNQKALAEKIGVSTGQISKYERGLSEPRPEILKKIANTLTISAETLLNQPRVLQGYLLTSSPNLYDPKKAKDQIVTNIQPLVSLPRLRVTAKRTKNDLPISVKSMDCYLSPEADEDFISEAKNFFYNYVKNRFGDDYDMTQMLEKYSLVDIKLEYNFKDDKD